MKSLLTTTRRKEHSELVFEKNISLQAYVLLYGLMTVLLVTREIPIIAPNIDDDQYIQYLATGWSDFDYSNPFAIVEEPLWAAYCGLLSMVVPPESGIRLTILLSALALGAIPLILRAQGLIFYAVWFAFHPHLAPEIAFNQIRQGFALALFLLLFAATRRIVIPAAIGTLFHTSVATLGILAVSRRHTVAITVVASLTLLLAFFTAEFGPLLGRRGIYLDEPIALTANYFIVNFGILVVFAYLLGRHERLRLAPDVFSTLFWGWFYLSISVLVLSMYMYFGPRLDYFTAYLLGLVIALGNQQADRRILYAKLFAMLLLVALNLRLEIQDEANSPIRNWALILGL